jgi:diguanylate cyclase (GGDEF)-like protein/PAS domain S-box-containing protein
MNRRTTDMADTGLRLDLTWLQDLGWSPEALLTGGWQALVPPEDVPRLVAAVERILHANGDGAVEEIVQRLKTRDGEDRWFALRARADATGAKLELDVEDVTEREQAASALDEHHRVMADAAPVAMWFADCDQRLQYVNTAWVALTDLPLHAVVGLDWREDVHPLDDDHLQRAVAGTTAFTVEYRRRCADGNYRWVFDSVIPRLDVEGKPSGWVGTSVDISERKALEEQLRHQAEHDPLTGLVNRRRFEAEFARQIERARDHGQPGALLLLDVDHFKPINDTHGHAHGDRVLLDVASALRERLRASDAVARIGGDEFAILLGRVSAKTAIAVAESLRERVHAAQPEVTVSVGLVHFEGGADADARALMDAADRALYDAKAGGRNRTALAALVSAE